MGTKLRKINLFEVILLVVGIGVGVIGFIIINNIYNQDPVLSWPLFQTVFLWLILIVMLILAATMEDVKEELAIVIKEQVDETRFLKEDTTLLREELVILRQISNEQLEELKLLGKNIFITKNAPSAAAKSKTKAAKAQKKPVARIGKSKA